MNTRKKIRLMLFLTTCYLSAFGQLTSIPELKRNFNEEGTSYMKAIIVGQFWTRYTDMNPRTTVNGFKDPSPFDIGIRRLRFNLMAQLNEKTFFYVQFGQNNFNYTSKLYTGSFFHDAVAEYKVLKNYFVLGTGLTGYSGLTRYAAPSIGSILGLDAPLYQQATNGVNDQFLRKLSIYAKGQVSKIDYRFILTKPMTANNSSVPIGTLNKESATFSLKPPKIQTQGYVNYQFFENESNTLAYTTGSYLGTKKILSVGAGWIQQNEALWHLNDKGDTINDQMVLLGADVFLELPFSDKKNALTFYAAYTDYQMGKNYIRNLGVMNPANTTNPDGTFSGAGNAVPLIGTGQTVYTQLAYKFRNNLLKSYGTLQVYTNVQYSRYQALKDPMIMPEAGLNWFTNGTHKSKITLGFQSRPVFDYKANSDLKEVNRKSMLVLQYQVSL